MCISPIKSWTKWPRIEKLAKIDLSTCHCDYIILIQCNLAIHLSNFSMSCDFSRCVDLKLFKRQTLLEEFHWNLGHLSRWSKCSATRLITSAIFIHQLERNQISYWRENIYIFHSTQWPVILFLNVCISLR